MESLQLLLKTKQATPYAACDVVNPAAEWLKKELREAGVEFHFADCTRDFCGYAHVQIHSARQGKAITLHLKIAEVKGAPYAFADIRVRDELERVMFPFFGEIGTEEGKETMLNFVADFLLSMPPKQ